MYLYVEETTNICRVIYVNLNVFDIRSLNDRESMQKILYPLCTHDKNVTAFPIVIF